MAYRQTDTPPRPHHHFPPLPITTHRALRSFVSLPFPALPMERASPLLARFGGHLRKHSNSAKKRIFGSRKNYEEVIKPAREEAANAPPTPLKYPPTYQPARVLPNGWSAPPDPATMGAASLPKDTLPFQVERTDKGRWLPVYTDVRKGRTQLITMVRKVSGDLEEMKEEMSKVCANQEVRIRTGPRLEVKGRYTTQLRGWLAGLGF